MRDKTGLIVTLYGNYNFGNKLQNYALVQILGELGLSTHTANVIYRYENHFMNIKNLIKKILVAVFSSSIDKRRKRKFTEFSSCYLNVTREKYHTNSVNRITKYDFIVYGSDQIWNPSCFGDSNLFLGYLGTKEQNIAYAASFGISSLPEKLQARYDDGFKNFHRISVREQQGLKIIQQSGRCQDIEVTLDPTLLIAGDVWQSIEKKPDNLSSNDYILVYFLGDMSDRIKNTIYRFSEKYKFQIVNIMDVKSPCYAIGPEEFLYLERNAKLVCTDSFHSCVFSFLFDTPFIVFDRVGVENMSSRMDTFLTKFKLEDRRFSGNIVSEHLLHNYENGRIILRQEIEKSIRFLKETLKINGR